LKAHWTAGLFNDCRIGLSFGTVHVSNLVGPPDSDRQDVTGHHLIRLKIEPYSHSMVAGGLEVMS